MRRIFLIISLTIFPGLVLTSFRYSPEANNKPAKAKQIKTIIVDAGHGHGRHGGNGPDGAHGVYSYEDDITLAVAKKLVVEIKLQLPDVKILETRPTDDYVSLKDRATFANQNNGDLFISIHVNSTLPLREVKIIGHHKETYYIYSGKGKKKKKIKKTRTVPTYKTYYYPNPANGTETYVFDSHKTDDKTDFITENGDNFMNETDDSTMIQDYNSPELLAQAALWTKKFFFNSIKLATQVEEEFNTSGRTSRGVKQRRKGIYVLQATAMPSILVETGYISHRPEEDYLNSEKGQQDIAETVTKAVKWYKEQQESLSKNNDTQSNGKH